MKRVLLLLLLVAGGPAWAQQQTLNQSTAWAAISPSDTVKLNPLPKALFIGNATACDLVLTANGASSSVTFSNVPSGAILPMRPAYVNASTGCTGIVALY